MSATQPPSVRAYAARLHLEMTARVSTQFVRKASLIATLLDPRFKRLRKIPKPARKQAWDALTSAAKHEQTLFQQPAPAQEDHDQERVVNHEGVHFHDFGDDDSDEGDAPANDTLESELAEYKALPCLDSGAPHYNPDMQQSPLAWWKIHASRFPILSRVARKYLAIHASSAAVERMFSYTGHRVSKKNANLHDETLLSMMLIRSLSKFVATYSSLV